MTGKVNIDRVFKHIGELGPQQLRYCLLLSFIGMYGAQIMLQYTFVGHDMPFTCILDIEDQKKLNTSSLYNECPSNKQTKCKEVKFDTTVTSSINSDWNLVCDRAWLSPLTMSSFMAGVMIGALVLGKVADSIGRKKTLSITFLFLLITNGLSALATSLPLYTLLRFTCGFFTSGYILANFVLLNELIGASKRGLVGVATQAFFAGGIVVFSLQAYFIRHWRELTAVSTAFALPLIILSHFILPESPRWLQSKGNIKEALEVLKYIALRNSKKWNDRLFRSSAAGSSDDATDSIISTDDSEGDDDEIVVHSSESVLENHVSKNRDSLGDLFKNNFLFKLTAIQIYTWFVNGACYYALTLAAGTTSGGLYISTALSGAVEFPAYALSIFLLSYFGRTTNIACFMVLGGLSLLGILVAAAFLPFIVTSLALLGKLCISSSFAIIYIHSNELFPTTIRNSGMGLVSVAARVGGILAPYIAKMGGILPNLHFLLLGILCLTSGISVAFLIDTKDKPLPESIDDLLSRRYHVVSVQSPSVSYKKVPTSIRDD